MTSLSYAELATANQGAIENVKKYYRYVDSRLFEKFTDIFTEDIVYDRCGVKFIGFYNLIHFYNKARALKGKHSIIASFQQNQNVVIEGVFDGLNGKQNEIEIQFVDLFKLRADNRAYYRASFFIADTLTVALSALPINLKEDDKQDATASTTDNWQQFYQKKENGGTTYKVLRKIQQEGLIAIEGTVEMKEDGGTVNRINFLDLFKIDAATGLCEWKNYLAAGYELSV